MSGLDIWASLLSTGAICTFYTTVVSDPSPHGGGAPCLLGRGGPGLAVHSLPSLPPQEAQSQLGLFPHFYNERRFERFGDKLASALAESRGSNSVLWVLFLSRGPISSRHPPLWAESEFLFQDGLTKVQEGSVWLALVLCAE